MKGGVRRFGAAARGLLPEGRVAGPMPWVIAIMMFLTLLAAAAGLGLAALGLLGGPPSDAVVEQHVLAATLGGAWSLTPTASPSAYGVVGLLVAAAALWLVVRPPVRRVRTAGGASGDVTDPLASWKAMDDGQDPTDSEGERA